MKAVHFVVALSFTPTAVPAIIYQRQSDLSECLEQSDVPTLFPSPSSSDWQSAILPYNRRLEGQYTPAACVLDDAPSCYPEGLTSECYSVAQPQSVEDVVNAVKCAAQFDVATVAKSGGHSYTAYSLGGQDGSLVVDLAALNNITLDGTIATVGAGSRLGDVALDLYNLDQRAFGHGTCPQVGIGGHALAGGFGLSSRQFGLSLDAVVEHQVVSANGSVVIATEDTNSELYWALRGAGGAFGIVTAFKIVTHPAPASNVVFTNTWDLSAIGPFSEAAQALAVFQSFGATQAPSALGLEIDLGRGSVTGRLAVTLQAQYMGTQADFETAIQPLLSQMPPTNSTPSITTGDWISALAALGNVDTLNTTGVADPGDTFYAASLIIPESDMLTNMTWQSFVGYLSTQGFESSTNWFAQIELYGGSNSAIAAVSAAATAFSHRDALCTLQFYASSSDYAPPYPVDGIAFVEGMRSSILDLVAPTFPLQAYSNYDDDQLSSNGSSPTSWQSEYYGLDYQRLVGIKEAFDPNNLFRWPQSIGSM